MSDQYLERDHTIYRFTDQIYKIIQWYDHRPCFLGSRSTESFNHYDEKLDASLSRSRRVVLEKALCNDWDFFCTFTISEEKVDRDDLAAWWKSFSQWLRDLRKQGQPIHFLFIPEKHASGSWHMHGLISGVDSTSLISFQELDRRGYVSPNGHRLPLKIRNAGYLNWPAYQEKFGFCSLAHLINPVAAAFYVTKYMTKDHARMVSDVGLHTYYTSQGLRTPVKHLDFYGHDVFIERLLTNRYEFCATGFTHLEDNCDWSFGFEHLKDGCSIFKLSDFGRECVLDELLDPPDFLASSSAEAARYQQFEQMCFDLKKGVVYV